MITEDEQVATERHRRRITRQRQHRVVQAVPVAYEWIDEIKDECECYDCWWQPPPPGAPKGCCATFAGARGFRRVCRQGLVQLVERRSEFPAVSPSLRDYPAHCTQLRP